jgi:N-acetylglucosaminyldiphosphoundecaprenol N-acetyl-beta-D-mannosaminyltransferase
LERDAMAEDRLIGVRLDPRSLQELILAAQGAVTARQNSFVFACANPHSLTVARKDTQFRGALEIATAVVADGVGCQWAAALSGASIGPRITGYDFFRALMSSLDITGGRAFFFGSSEEVLLDIANRAKLDYPRVSIATLSPPFTPWSEEENHSMIERIHEFAPDVLWVGMTAPKQEKWVASNAHQIRVPVIGSIGAVFGYYAGVTPRAPQWICEIGLEWLYRLPREPRRLWKRTFISAPLFLWFVLLDRMRRW